MLDIATDSAQAFWSLLLPVGLSGGALQHMKPARNNDDDGEDEDEDIDMNNGTDNTQVLPSSHPNKFLG